MAGSERQEAVELAAGFGELTGIEPHAAAGQVDVGEIRRQLRRPGKVGESFLPVVVFTMKTTAPQVEFGIVGAGLDLFRDRRDADFDVGVRDALRCERECRRQDRRRKEHP